MIKYAIVMLLALLFYVFMEIKAYDLMGILTLLLISAYYDWRMRK
jgi:hypothetical protein